MSPQNPNPSDSEERYDKINTHDKTRIIIVHCSSKNMLGYKELKKKHLLAAPLVSRLPIIDGYRGS